MELRLCSANGADAVHSLVIRSAADGFIQAVTRHKEECIGAELSRLRWLQQGSVQLYVLYIALTLLALLIWKLW